MAVIQAVTGFSLAALFACLAVVVSALGLFLGVPQWRMQRHALELQRKQDRRQELMELLIGQRPPRSQNGQPVNAIVVLEEIRDMLSEQAELTAIVAHHVSDGHGGQLPPWFRSPTRT